LSLHPATTTLKTGLHPAATALQASLYPATGTELQRALKSGLHPAIDAELQCTTGKAGLHSATINTIQHLPSGAEHSAQDVYSRRFVAEYAIVIGQQHLHSSRLYSRCLFQRRHSRLV
jgi:hypothetical protein